MASTVICCAAVPEQRAIPGRELIILRLQAIPLGFEVRNALRALSVRSARNSCSLATNLRVGRSNRSGRAWRRGDQSFCCARDGCRTRKTPDAEGRER